MKQKWQALFLEIQKMVILNPGIAAGIALILLLMIWKKPKFILSLGFLSALGLTVWFWFNSSFDNRNQNKKFQRYQDNKTDSRAGKAAEGE
jgi:hypothetical protein